VSDDAEWESSTFVAPPEGERSRRFDLVVIEGPDTGKTFSVDASRPTRTLVGTSPACELRLTDVAISRRHLALELGPHGLRVTDLGSTNGTFVDRVRIKEAELRGEELLRVGSTVIRVDAHDDPARRLSEARSFGRLVGGSDVMRRLYPLCERLAASDVPVVIEGETGTGKEVLAEALHEAGARASGPFEVFDCTTVAPSLLESELFGHERGAFTGAVAARKGVFEQASGGTLFIDEIGDLDVTLQPKLLRALERGEIRRVGGDRWLRVDVRIIAATRRDLDKEVQAGRFRDDLLHRLAVARVELPPLRHRAGDIELLATHFWTQMGDSPRLLPAAAIQRWSDYDWPGNVRELRNSVARQLALGDLAPGQDRRSAAPPPPSGSAASPFERYLASALPFPEARDRLVEEFGREYALRMLAAHGGDVARAAEACGIGRRYFHKLRAKRTE